MKNAFRQDLWLLPTDAEIAALGLERLLRWLARAERLPELAPGLAECFEAAIGASLPWAALLRQAQAGDAADACWLVADLLCVRAEIGRARVLGEAAVLLPEARLLRLAEAVCPWLAEEGIEVAPLRPGRLLLRLPESMLPPVAQSSEALQGYDLGLAMPSALAWQRRINEMQILLAQHPENQASLAAAAPAANTLWFWGAGRLAELPAMPGCTLDSEDPLLQALAAQANWPCHPTTRGRPVLHDLRDPERLARAWQRGQRPRSGHIIQRDGQLRRPRWWQRWQWG